MLKNILISVADAIEAFNNLLKFDRKFWIETPYDSDFLYYNSMKKNMIANKGDKVEFNFEHKFPIKIY